MGLKVYAEHGIYEFPSAQSYEHDDHMLDILSEDDDIYLATFNQWDHVEWIAE